MVLHCLVLNFVLEFVLGSWIKLGTSSCRGLFCEMQRLLLGKQRGYGFREVWYFGFVLDSVLVIEGF